MVDLMVETLQVHQTMAAQQIREYYLFLSYCSPIYYAYLRRDHECKYCYTDLQ